MADDLQPKTPRRSDDEKVQGRQRKNTLTSLMMDLGIQFSLEELMPSMRDKIQGIKIQDRRHNLVWYRNCFTAKQMVEWLVARKVAQNTGQALKLMSDWRDLGFINSLTQGPKDHIQDDENLFRFQEDETDNKVLNLRHVFIGKARPMAELGEHLRASLQKIFGRYISKGGHYVNYKGLKESAEFKEYITAAEELQGAEPFGMKRNEALSFWINIYNALVMHGIFEYGPPSRWWMRGKFFQIVQYKIGGHTYSLDDIEHGILRGNKAHGSSNSIPFPPNDPRLKFVVMPFDPRIHFALVCGGASCPPLRLWRPDNIDDGLNAAAHSFCEDEIQIDMNHKTVTMSKIFEWYQKDFGETPVDVLLYASEFMSEKSKNLIRDLAQGDKLKIKYSEYDWALNGQLK